MKKQKRQLIGGILLMILGLGISTGSIALRYLERNGLGPFHAENKIVNRHRNGNFGFRNSDQDQFGLNPNFKNRIPRNQNGSQKPVPPSSQNQNQNQNQNQSQAPNQSTN